VFQRLFPYTRLFILRLLFILFTAGILLPFAASSQVCDSNLCIPREIIIKTSLTGPIQNAAYGALAVEVPVWKQLAVQAEASYIYHFIHNTSRLDNGSRSGGIKLDLKYYFPKSTTMRIYTGPSVSYRNMNTMCGKYDWRMGVDNLGNPMEMPYVNMTDASFVKTSNTDILWQVGIQPYLVKHVALSVYTGAGLGIEHRKVTSGAEPKDLGDKNFAYFSKILGVHLGFAF
jgi:hypothetical protein